MEVGAFLGGFCPLHPHETRRRSPEGTSSSSLSTTQTWRLASKNIPVKDSQEEPFKETPTDSQEDPFKETPKDSQEDPLKETQSPLESLEGAL